MFRQNIENSLLKLLYRLIAQKELDPDEILRKSKKRKSERRLGEDRKT